MDSRLFLAVALSVVIVMGYQEYLRVYYPQLEEATEEPRPKAGPTASDVPAPVPPREAPPVEAKAASSEPIVADVEIETPEFSAIMASRGARLTSLKLKDYRTTIDPDSPRLELVVIGPGGEFPLGLTLRGETPWTDADVAYQPSVRSLSVAAGESAEIVFNGLGPNGEPLAKVIRFHGTGYLFDVGVRAIDPARHPEISLTWMRARGTGAVDSTHYEGGQVLAGRRLLQFEEEELDRGVLLPDPKTSATPGGAVFWAGYADTYFISALTSAKEDKARAWLKLAGGAVRMELLLPSEVAKDEAFPFAVYAGPKDIDALGAAGHNLARALDLGWFSFVAEPMLHVLKLFHRATGNYGIDIILLTVIIKVLFIPLTQKSFKSMQEMQKLQPQMKKLQEKYKDDRTALNKEMMELYRRHKVNPLGGCLPMLLQMPVFIGLYNALFYAVELRHAPFLLWMNDLSAPDRLPPVPVPPLAVIAGTDIRIPVLTLLMGATMLIQQRMTPAVGDPMQQRMMMFMPVVFTVMFVSFPAGLVLYWLINNVLTIAQQALVQRAAARA